MGWIWPGGCVLTAGRNPSPNTTFCICLFIGRASPLGISVRPNYVPSTKQPLLPSHCHLLRGTSPFKRMNRPASWHPCSSLRTFIHVQFISDTYIHGTVTSQVLHLWYFNYPSPWSQVLKLPISLTSHSFFPISACIRAVLSNTVATSHMWLLSTWKQASANWDGL